MKNKTPEERIADYEVMQKELTDPATRELIKMLLEQVLIVLVERAGGSIDLPASEIDQTGGKILLTGINTEKRSIRLFVQKAN